MANYALEIDKYRKLGKHAEEAGDIEMAKVANDLVKSYEERSNDPSD